MDSDKGPHSDFGSTTKSTWVDLHLYKWNYNLGRFILLNIYYFRLAFAEMRTLPYIVICDRNITNGKTLELWLPSLRVSILQDINVKKKLVTNRSINKYIKYYLSII